MNIDLDLLKKFIIEIKPSVSKKVVLVAHNSGTFDGQYIIDYYKNSSSSDKVLPIMRGNKMIYIDIFRDDKHIKVIDSMQHIKGSLQKIANDFDIAEKKGYLPYE